MGRFIIGMLLLLAAAFFLVLWKRYDKRDGSSVPLNRYVGIPLAVLAVLFLAWSTVRIVPPRSVGVEVTFGKVTDSYGSGPHIVAPWASVRSFPSTINTVILDGDPKSEKADGPCVTVRLGNQTTACVRVTAQWSVNTQDSEAVQALYARWRGFSNIEPGLIIPQLQHSLLAPFEKYDPLQVLQDNGQLVTLTGELESQARAQLEKAIGNGIVLNTLTINLVAYDNTTQDKLNAYAQAVADTRIAEQRKNTADAQRQANEALAGSGASRDPGVLYQNCIDMTERLAKEGKGLPAAWSCGSQAQTVVPVR